MVGACTRRIFPASPVLLHRAPSEPPPAARPSHGPRAAAVPPGGTASTHLPLNVQLVLELPAGQALQGPGLLPANEAVRSVAVHGDIVGRAVSLCNEDPGHTPEPESFLWATQESPGPAGQLPEATGRRGDGVGCWGAGSPGDEHQAALGVGSGRPGEGGGDVLGGMLL